MNFSAKDAAREKVLPLCREAIRYCSQAIRAVHRQEFDQAKGLLQSARNRLDRAEQAITACSELSNTGFFRDAQKEFAEGSITLDLGTGEKHPDPGELVSDPAPYLNVVGVVMLEVTTTRAATGLKVDSLFPTHGSSH